MTECVCVFQIIVMLNGEAAANQILSSWYCTVDKGYRTIHVPEYPTSRSRGFVFWFSFG